MAKIPEEIEIKINSDELMELMLTNSCSNDRDQVVHLISRTSLQKSQLFCSTHVSMNPVVTTTCSTHIECIAAIITSALTAPQDMVAMLRPSRTHPRYPHLTPHR